MKKYLWLLVSIPFITGAACNPTLPQEPCAEVPIYHPYTIEVPVRPVLNADKITDRDSEGVIVRIIEDDYSLLMEYALKLENIIRAIPKTLMDASKKP
jgi:hypothetical protein